MIDLVRRSACLAVAAGCLTLGLSATTSAVEAPESTSFGVSGACTGGGRYDIRAERSGDDLVITTSVRGVRENSRWIVMVDESDERMSDSYSTSFTPVAHDGAWSSTRRLPVVPDSYVTFTAMQARGNAGCVAFVSAQAPMAAAGGCRPSGMFSFGAAWVVERANGPIVRFQAGRMSPGSRWNVDVHAVVDGTETTQTVKSQATKRGMIGGRAQLSGDEVTEVRIDATSNRGGHCVFTTHLESAPDVPTRTAPQSKTAVDSWVRELSTLR